MAAFEEVDNDLDYVEFGRGGTSSRGSSEDRSSSRGSSVNRNLPSSRSQLKDDEKEIKYAILNIKFIVTSELNVSKVGVTLERITGAQLL